MRHRWRTDLNWLCGATVSRWAALLGTDRVHREYLHRGLQISALSLYNSLAHRVDRVLAGPVEDVPIEAPLFVLGHWRSGTTLLYQLLARDPGLAAPNAFQVVNPRSFASTEAFATRVFGSLVPEKRVQDDMELGFHTPEEDEYAIALLSGASPYLGRSFPERNAFYERFLTLRDCSADERESVHRAMRLFLSRLTSVTSKRLVLKSPPHTARVRYLLDWFPDARFVHVHRDPYRVFASTRHLYDTVDWFWTLQRRPEDSDTTILRQYGLLHDAWFADRDRIPTGRLVELAYEDLVRDPMGALDGVYRGLDLPGFPEAAPRIRAGLRADYQPNVFPPLDARDRARVREVAEPCFEAWGYPR